jgi:hypothetical protein
VRTNDFERNEAPTEIQHTGDNRIEMNLKKWIKRLGFWGVMFFLLKGLLWLTIPALIAIFATD